MYDLHKYELVIRKTYMMGYQTNYTATQSTLQE